MQATKTAQQRAQGPSSADVFLVAFVGSGMVHWVFFFPLLSLV
jgi:hypothetical protein